MSEKSAALNRMQLTDALRKYPTAHVASPPRNGWARAVREALGVTQAQLATRLGITRQSIQDLESAEASRRITLESLDRLASAMGCHVVYAVVPESGSLDDLRQRRASAVAEEMLKAANHSMSLEAQGVSKRERARQKKRFEESLLRGSSRQLWK